MKKQTVRMIVVAVMILAFASSAPAQPVWEGNFSIDSLAGLATLTGYTEVTGNLSIDNSTLISLAGLESLTTVGGDLHIQNNDWLASLSGLDNLTSVGGDLDIWGNDALASLNALSRIATVAGSLTIGNMVDYEFIGNPALTTLAGFDSLTGVGGDLNIRGNDTLASLSGLNHLASVGGTLQITHNPLLTGLNELETLNTLGGALKISFNAVLTDLSALSSLAGVEVTVIISTNAALASLNGLYNLDLNGSLLRIIQNPSLCIQEAYQLLEELQSRGFTGRADIYENNGDCPPEILKVTTNQGQNGTSILLDNGTCFALDTHNLIWTAQDPGAPDDGLGWASRLGIAHTYFSYKRTADTDWQPETETVFYGNPGFYARWSWVNPLSRIGAEGDYDVRLAAEDITGNRAVVTYQITINTTDTDADGALDCIDNCPWIANPLQADADLDGIGDLCDPVPVPIRFVEVFDFGDDREEVWDMTVYNNKLYISVAQDLLIENNSGWLYEYDGEGAPVLRRDFSAEQGGIKLLRVIDNLLYIPGADSLGSIGKIYIYDGLNDLWAETSIEDPDPLHGSTDHLVDIIKYNGKFYATCNNKDGEPIIYVSPDGNSNWQPAYEPRQWGLTQMIEFNDRLYVADGTYRDSTVGSSIPSEKLIIYDGLWSESDWDPPDYIGGIPQGGTSYSYDKYRINIYYNGEFYSTLQYKGTADKIMAFEIFGDELYFGTLGDIYRFDDTMNIATSVLATDKTVWDFDIHEGRLYAAVSERYNDVTESHSNDTHRPESLDGPLRSDAWVPYFIYDTQMFLDWNNDAQIWFSDDGDAWKLLVDGVADAVHTICSYNGKLYVGLSGDGPNASGKFGYLAPDSDNDGIVDESDNCPATCNPLQLDADLDGTGDLCDGDPGCTAGGCSPCEEPCAAP